MCRCRSTGRTCFNPRPRMGGDSGRLRAFRSYLVSIHAPAWGATGRWTEPMPWVRFNPRPRMGGDEAGLRLGAGIGVSIHAPAWGATYSIYSVDVQALFQSTPPHGGRLGHVSLKHTCPAVSIHAPAWGATGYAAFNASNDGFNPRPRMGGDAGRYYFLSFFNVSIHAPAWGATTPSPWCLSRPGCFNPRPRMGGDFRWFQNGNHCGCFNPRPRMGGDASRQSPLSMG